MNDLEKKGQEIADAMGRYRGNEPLVDAVKRLSNDHVKLAVRLGDMTGLLVEVLRKMEDDNLQRAGKRRLPTNPEAYKKSLMGRIDAALE